LLELLEELEELVGGLDGLPAELEPFDVLEEFAGFEFEPPLDVPPVDDEPPVPVLTDELPVLVSVVCVVPGRTAATAPAATTLAKPTVAVAVFSLRLPRSRSATACDTCRAAVRSRGEPQRSSQLSILAVCHASL
jgi:hypothetical protein